jgi:hypothetical protein
VHEPLHTLDPLEPQLVAQLPDELRQQPNPLSHAPSQSSSAPLQLSAGGVQLPHEQDVLHERVPVEPQPVVQLPESPRQQPNPSSHVPSQSSSAPLHVSAGGSHAPHVHPPEQVCVPVVPQPVEQPCAAPRQQPNPSSHDPSQSSSSPLHVSSGGMHPLHSHRAEQSRAPSVPHDDSQASSSPRQQEKPLSHPPVQSSSCPLQTSAGGVQAAAAGTWQSRPQMPLPVDPQTVVHPTSLPIRQGKLSSTWPSQLSSTPLHVSAGEVGAQPASHEPSPSGSVQPASHRTPQRPSSQTGTACRPAVQTVPHSPQFRMSVMTSAQEPPQATVPEGHSKRQTPLEQTSAGWQGLSHPPQWSWSVLVSTHTPPQSV